MESMTSPTTSGRPAASAPTRARIRVVGVGGAGGNAVAHMRQCGVREVECIAMNTDAQALAASAADRHLQLGQDSTRGLGAGGNPDVGARAAEESEQQITEALTGAELVFITLGLGGGTGTGAGPIIARIARRLGALIVGLATLPFTFEGRRRIAAAQTGLAQLREHVDTLIAVPNDRIFGATTPQTVLRDAFRITDEVLRQGVAGVADLVAVPGLINLDLADLRAVLSGAGSALLAIGEADGAERARHAARLALSSPLLGLEARGARGIVCNITGGDDLTLSEVQTIAEAVGAVADPAAMLIFGAVTDPAFTGRIRATVIATGFDAPPGAANAPGHSMLAGLSQEGTTRGRAAVVGSRFPQPAPTKVEDLPTMPLPRVSPPSNVREPIQVAWTPPDLDLPSPPAWSSSGEFPVDGSGPLPMLPDAANAPLGSSSPRDPRRTRVIHDSSLIPAYLRRVGS